MKLKDKIGMGITSFMYPYIQNYTKESGGNMPRVELNNEFYNLQEKYLWFLGNEELLADFYATRTQSSLTIDTKSSYYYSNLDSRTRILHSGLPSLCSYAKANLLLSGGLDIDVKVNDRELEKEETVLENILIDNDYKTFIKRLITTESWAGKFAIKFSIDKEVSEYPIMELYSPLSYKAIKKRGRLQELVFIEHYGKYDLHERYGKGYIKYELYFNNKQVPLNAIEETALLEDVVIPNGKMWAVEKCDGKSDYNGIISEFDALDETWSQLMDEIRMARTETYVPDILMDGKKFNEFSKKYVVVGTDQKENGKNEISHNQPNIRTEEYTKSLVAIRNNVLANFGLSPITIGIADETGANASGESLTKREVVSLRTRSQMVQSWQEFLDKLCLLALNIHGIDKKDMCVQTVFGDYITPTRKEIIENVKLLKDSDIIDNEKALEEVYGDELDDSEKARILANLGEVSFEVEE